MPKQLKPFHEESTYLKLLKFPKELLNIPVAKYLNNPRLVLLLLLSIIITGVFSYISLTRTINPEIKIPLVVVSTVLPGAGPADVESLVTVPLEDAIRSVQKVKTVASTSRDSVSMISVEFESGVDPEKAQSDIKSAVDTVTDLPSDAQTPRVNKVDFENQPVWNFVVSGGENTISLLEFSKVLQKDLEELALVDQVSVSGLETQEVQILVKPEAFTTYALNPQQLTQAIKSSLKSLPAGAVKTESSTFALTVDPAITSLDDIRDLKLRLNGAVVSLSDIAVVSQHPKPEQARSFITVHNGEPMRAVSFNVYRTSGAKIDQTVEKSKEVVNEKLKEYNNVFKIYSISDVGEELDKQFKDLQRDFILTISLVSLTLLVFLGIRQASISILAIPITFLFTFLVMYMAGVSLSFISQFSLLLSLGLLVDDTIVVVSAMTAYYRSGKFTPLQTGLLVWKDFLVPVLTTTLTTVWAFLPLLLSTGIIGEFIKPIPIVVSASLLGSIIIAMLITLPLMIIFLKPQVPYRVFILLRVLLLFALLAIFYSLMPRNNIVMLEVLAFLIFLFVTFQVRSSLASFLTGRVFKRFYKPGQSETVKGKFANGLISFVTISAVYKRLIKSILISPSARRKTIIMVVIFSLFSYLLLPLGLVKNEFFPKTDNNYIFINVELPPGTNLEKTTQEGMDLLKQLNTVPEVDFITLDLGRNFGSGMGISSSQSNNLLYSVVLTDFEHRQIDSMEISQMIRQKLAGYTAGKVSVQEVSGGPPAGSDLQIKLFGADLNTLNQNADKIQKYLEEQPGVANIDKSIKPGTSKLVFVPDRVKLAENGLTQDVIGFWMRLYASGLTADKIKVNPEDTEKSDINIRLNSQTPQADTLTSIQIPTQSGLVPITYLGQIELEPNPTLITREDGKRTLSVTASVTKGYSIATINQQLERFADSLNLSNGYSWQTGGVNEENQRSVNSILQAMVLSFLLIIITMVVQFASFRKAIIVMLVIPLSISGVFIIFALAQIPLSFPALIGILALFGIVVKNSILVVDKINANIKTGMEFTESIADAAASRLEPIALTSLTAIFGLIPVTLSSALWQGLGGAIIAGLTFSGTIMLFFIPVVYYLIFHSSESRIAKRK